MRVTAPPREWRDILDSPIARTRGSLPITLLVSGFVETPVAIGWLKPAYGLPEGRDYLFRGPDWMNTENFDIAPKFAPGASDSQVLSMLQRLLDERFRMKLHRESREFSVLAMVVRWTTSPG